MARVPRLPDVARFGSPADWLGRPRGSVRYEALLRVKEGTADARMGVATLVGGTLVVPTSAVAANSRIFLTCQVPGGTPGFLRVSARVAGTTFTILSSSGSDVSQVAWLLADPA